MPGLFRPLEDAILNITGTPVCICQPFEGQAICIGAPEFPGEGHPVRIWVCEENISADEQLELIKLVLRSLKTQATGNNMFWLPASRYMIKFSEKDWQIIKEADPKPSASIGDFLTNAQLQSIRSLHQSEESEQ